MYSPSYINPDFAIANARFSSLLHTAISAIFLLLPFATIRSYKFLQALLYLQALKLHINNKFLSFWLPILLILGLPLILLPLYRITGVIPA